MLISYSVTQKKIGNILLASIFLSFLKPVKYKHYYYEFHFSLRTDTFDDLKSIIL